MPTYQYRCRDCGEDLEVVQSFTDDALTTCPTCEGSLKKVFSAVGISFKGSGFYKTDSRGSSRSASSTPASGTGDSGSGTSSSGTSSSDTSSSSSSSSDSSSTTTTSTAAAST